MSRGRIVWLHTVPRVAGSNRKEIRAFRQQVYRLWLVQIQQEILDDNVRRARRTHFL